MNSHITLTTLLLGVITGIVIGEKSVYASPILLMVFAAFVIEGGIFLLSSRKGKKSHVAFFIACYMLGISLGGVRTQFEETKPSIICTSKCTIEGRVVHKEEIKDTHQSFDIRVGDDTRLVRVRAPLYPSYEIGMSLSLIGTITAPKVFYPHADKKIFDYPSYLRLHDVGSEMLYPVIEVKKSDELLMKEKLRVFQASLILRISQYVTEPASYLASGMLLGVASFSSEILQTFRTAGLSHIIVLSGFNITILIVCVMLLLRPLPVYLRVVVATSVILLFIIMVGGGSSLVRASGMAFISLLALFLGREYVATQALLLSLLAILLYTPTSLFYDVSLHLSFLATAGIVYLYSSLKLFFERVRIQYGAEIIASTCTAYIATLPYIMYTFGTVSLYAIFSNALALPLVPITMLSTALTLLSSYIHPFLGSLFGVMTGVLGDILILIAVYTEKIPGSTFMISITALEMVFMYIIMLLVAAFLITGRSNETAETKEEEIISSILRF